MKHIFHLMTIFFIMYEMIWIVSPVEKTKSAKRYKELSKEYKGKKREEYSEEYKHLINTKLPVTVIMLLWMFSGLMTFNWIIFLFMLLFNIVVISPISKLTAYSKAYIIIHWLNSVKGLVLGLFILINSYHLQIDLYQLILNYFN